MVNRKVSHYTGVTIWEWTSTQCSSNNIYKFTDVGPAAWGGHINSRDFHLKVDEKFTFKLTSTEFSCVYFIMIIPRSWTQLIMKACWDTASRLQRTVTNWTQLFTLNVVTTCQRHPHSKVWALPFLGCKLFYTPKLYYYSHSGSNSFDKVFIISKLMEKLTYLQLTLRSISIFVYLVWRLEGLLTAVT